MTRDVQRPTLFPYTTLFRSQLAREDGLQRRLKVGEERREQFLPGLLDVADAGRELLRVEARGLGVVRVHHPGLVGRDLHEELRSEEHTSELQSHSDLVCRLL